MELEIGIGIIGLIIAAAALGYQQGWIPPKYRLPGTDLMTDPLTRNLFGPPERFENHPRKPLVVIRNMVPLYERDGFRIVRVLFGRECILGRELTWTGKVSDGSIQELVVMAKLGS